MGLVLHVIRGDSHPPCKTSDVLVVFLPDVAPACVFFYKSR